jgi:hypothetical protein
MRPTRPAHLIDLGLIILIILGEKYKLLYSLLSDVIAVRDFLATGGVFHYAEACSLSRYLATAGSFISNVKIFWIKKGEILKSILFVCKMCTAFYPTESYM